MPATIQLQILSAEEITVDANSDIAQQGHDDG